MANNKDFVVAGAVEVGKDTKVTLGTVTSNNIDLATGNYFADTPSGASTYTISNAGAVQSFQLEVTGGTEEVAQNFSTTLYAGTSASLTINNGIDLAGEDGLTWIKCRNASEDHFLFSSLQNGSGQTLFLRSNTTGAAGATNGVSQTATGFTVPVDGMVNQTGNNYASWSFKKEPSFFDVVTWSGNSTSGRTISHSLGSLPGMIIVKNLTTSGSGYSDWRVWHRSENNKTATLNTTAAFSTTDAASKFGNGSSVVQPTSTEFTVAADYDVNRTGENYVAYLFAHDNAADGLIQCGSYTGNGSTDGPEINLGWQPQWVMIKAATRPGGENWVIYDTQRGIVTGSGDPALFPSDSAAEDFGGSADNSIDLLSTGFKIVGTSGRVNDSYDYIYVAIRAASDLDITWPSSIEWTGGSAPSSPATGETDVFTLSTDDGGTTYTGIKSIDNAS